MGESAVQRDRIPASGRSPAGPQSNQNVWVLPAILRDVCDRCQHGALDFGLEIC